MQRVVIARQPVRQCLVFARLVGDLVGRLRVGETRSCRKAPRSPPQPPSPRQNRLDRVLSKGFPVAALTASDSVSITAALRLSQMAAMRPAAFQLAVGWNLVEQFDASVRRAPSTPD